MTMYGLGAFEHAEPLMCKERLTDQLVQFVKALYQHYMSYSKITPRSLLDKTPFPAITMRFPTTMAAGSRKGNTTGMKTVVQLLALENSMG